MTDRVYPKSKPSSNTKTATATATVTAATAATPKPRLPPPPPGKTQFHNPNTNRHPHRPNPTTNHRTRRRGCFCLCCFWSILIIILLLLISAVAGCILYLLYHPNRPTFSIAAVKISELNLTTTTDDTTKLTTKINLTISTRNTNQRITFYYDSIAITCLSDETQIATGYIRNSIVSNPNNITIIRSSLYGNSLIMETQSVNQIRSNLKKKYGLPLKIVMDTEARVKIESLRSKKIGIRIKCEGIHSLISKGGKSRNSSSKSVAANVSAAKCKFDLRIKIWKWTF